MPTHNDETLLERYQREALVNERIAQSANPLNYDPADPDKMRLPPGTTCGNCVHLRRCVLIFGHTETDTICDWSPSRFHARPTVQRLPADDTEGGE